MGRIRCKIAATVDKNTLDVLEALMKREKLSSQSEAIDILANHYLLTQGLGSGALDEMNQRLLSRRTIILSDIESSIKELSRNIIEEQLMDERGKMQPTPIQTPPSAPVKKVLDELLAQCKATTSDGIELWANQNIIQIEGAGASVNAFVCEKIMQVQRLAKIEAGRVYREKIVSVPDSETEGQKWVRHTSEAMVQYWRTYLDNNTLLIETKMFQVARYSKAVMGVVQKMNNGQKEEYLLTVVDQLRNDAEQRKWDTEKYVHEWKTIYDNADTILKRNQDVN
jgi:hypothetical protein